MYFQIKELRKTRQKQPGSISWYKNLALSIYLIFLFSERRSLGANPNHFYLFIRLYKICLHVFNTTVFRFSWSIGILFQLLLTHRYCVEMYFEGYFNVLYDVKQCKRDKGARTKKYRSVATSISNQTYMESIYIGRCMYFHSVLRIILEISSYQKNKYDNFFF